MPARYVTPGLLDTWRAHRLAWRFCSTWKHKNTTQPESRYRCMLAGSDGAVLLQGARRHSLNRHSVTTLRCNFCGEVQPLAQQCTACGTVFGQYACLKCRFFDHDTHKKQFHCPQCNICRVGGATNFFHCNECGCCYDRALQVRSSSAHTHQAHIACMVTDTRSRRDPCTCCQPATNACI